jgi:hypothetical protein
VRLFDGHILTGLGLPVFCECRIEFAVQLARRIIRDVEQGLLRGGQPRCGHQRGGHRQVGEVLDQFHEYSEGRRGDGKEAIIGRLQFLPGTVQAVGIAAHEQFHAGRLRA